MHHLAPDLNVLISHGSVIRKPPSKTAVYTNKKYPTTNPSSGMTENNKFNSGSYPLSPRRLAVLTPVNEEYELLEYEWPDLPPLEQIRDALARGRISKGIDYLLPIDKTKNSVDCLFRTNLRIMFKEPYLESPEHYNEDMILKLAKHHLNTNTLPDINRPKCKIIDHSTSTINQDSEKNRLMYSYSAPQQGIVGRNATVESLRQRSSLNFPQKQHLPPEAMKLKEEAERILKSVQEKEQDQEEEYDPKLHDRQILNEQAMGKYRRSPDKRRPLNSRRSLPSREMMKNLASRGRVPSKTKSAKFRSYDELKNSEIPIKRDMPSRLRSRYMSDNRSEAVWDWLNQDEQITDFTYFLEVCS